MAPSRQRRERCPYLDSVVTRRGDGPAAIGRPVAAQHPALMLCVDHVEIFSVSRIPHDELAVVSAAQQPCAPLLRRKANIVDDARVPTQLTLTGARARVPDAHSFIMRTRSKPVT